MKNKDFILSSYKQLLQELRKNNYKFLTVDALKIAKIENELGIKASYYFRIGKESNQPEIIKQIAK
jgi:hypothetical protein